jgi:hypothetical protein
VEEPKSDREPDAGGTRVAAVRTRTNFGIATGAFISERDDWAAAVGRAAAERWRFVELTAIIEDRLDSLAVFFQRSPTAVSGFERVSIHAPVIFRTSAAAVVEKIASCQPDLDVVFHPDVYRSQSLLQRLGSRVVFENMDVAKGFGRSLKSLCDVFDEYLEAGFCLDVAHVWTNDPSLRLAYELLDSFGVRLRQLHLSGIEPDGTHRPTTSADLDLYGPVLDRCLHVPWLLEAELVSPLPP